MNEREGLKGFGSLTRLLFRMPYPCSKQKDLVNAIVVACSGKGARGGEGEAPVLARPHKEFLRDLLLAQGIQKTPGSELDELLAR